MKYIFLFLLFTLSVYADQIKSKTLGCPTIDALKNAPIDGLDNPMSLNMYAITSGCEIISKKDKVEAIGYDPRNEIDKFQQIIYKRTNTTLYILRSSIIVEQGGKKNGIRF